jgi:hypothetical protein
MFSKSLYSENPVRAKVRQQKPTIRNLSLKALSSRIQQIKTAAHYGSGEYVCCVS